jgi:hypothetical protein
MADETTQPIVTTATGAKVPAVIGHLGLGATYCAAALLTGLIAANLYLFAPGHATPGWLALFVDAAPPVALLLSTLASYINYFGTWRILRHHDEYSAGTDLKSHAADIPAALQGLPTELARRLGCGTVISVALLGASLLTTGLTLAPPPFHFLGVTSGPAAQATPTPTPTPTPAPSPTPTPVPTLSVALNPAQSTWDCNTGGRSITPVSLTLDNSASNVDAQWTATPREILGAGTTAQRPWAGVKPNQGIVPAGQSATIAISPSSNTCVLASPTGTPYHVDIALSGGSAGSSTATFTETITGLRRVSFALKPAQASGVCATTSTQLQPVTVTLDNSGSNVDVGWKATIKEQVGQNGQNPWASVKANQGTVPAGQTTQITITPANNVCSTLPPSGSASYHVDITLTSGGNGTNTFTYTVSLG